MTVPQLERVQLCSDLRLVAKATGVFKVDQEATRSAVHSLLTKVVLLMGFGAWCPVVGTVWVQFSVPEGRGGGYTECPLVVTLNSFFQTSLPLDLLVVRSWSSAISLC